MDISVRTQNLFIFISLVKLIHSHRKYSRKNFFRWRFPKCGNQTNKVGRRSWRSRQQNTNLGKIPPLSLRETEPSYSRLVKIAQTGGILHPTSPNRSPSINSPTK